ncbi:DUF4241 domain-containing protein [Inquilinus sp. Marseille-Q2685]|uniref:DUF4241 domain-containing protein n=1 Tax=Inquilinus sp. Marseille-Q2685 TaxID=2866581 RepID=UPI001CE46FBF|nr:DUF4241 domain-containing protein [Inquilinus sp. Marseille-Q2685]
MDIGNSLLGWVRRVPPLVGLLLVAACATARTDNGQIPPSAMIGSAFEAGAKARVIADGKPVEFSTVSPGDIEIPSGRIVVCDPFACDPGIPFTKAVPTGRFPVQLAVARAPSGEQQVAYARILFSARPAVRWEMALPPGESIDGSQTNYAFGFPVESGTGSFMDATVQEPYLAAAADPNTKRQLIAALNEHQTSGATWLVRPFGPGTVAMFSTGFGDGYYISYFGLDDAGRIVSLTTDLGVIERPRS